MKKIFALLLAICVCFCGCVSTEPQIDPNLVVTKITSFDETSINYTVINNWKYGIEFGNDYHLEYKDGENWAEVPEQSEVFFTMIAYVLNPSEEKSFFENLEMRYGKLSNGTYRIVKDIRLLNEDGEICGTQETSAEFEISKEILQSEETKEENPDTSPKEEENPEIFEEPSLDFRKFTDRYYLKIAVPEEIFYTVNPILEGRTVDFDKITLLYVLKDAYGNLGEKEQFEAFLKDYYKTEKLRDMYVASGMGYLATASYGEDERVGITISVDGKYQVGQIGGIPNYIFPETEEIYSELSEIFGSESLGARFVSLTPNLNGILLSSETKEYMIIQDAFWDFENVFEKGKIYKASEVVAKIEKLEPAIVG